MSAAPDAPRYDTIGRTYAQARRADPRIEAQILAAIGDAGLREMRRVADRQAIFAFDPSTSATYWLVDDYFPEYRALESEWNAPTPDDIGRHLDSSGWR